MDSMPQGGRNCDFQQVIKVFLFQFASIIYIIQYTR